MGNKTAIPADKVAELKKARPVDALAFDGATFQDVTVEKLDGKDYNVLSSDKGKFYFDVTTGLLYKTIAGRKCNHKKLYDCRRITVSC